MNMSPAQEELDIPEKPKDNELFEFRASENDVIQESAGSSQSIYSAEEVNPEGDNKSNSSNGSSNSNTSSSSSSSNEGNRAFRHSTGTTVTTTLVINEETVALTAAANERQQIERSRSLDNEGYPSTVVAQTQLQSQQLQHHVRQHNHNHVFRNRYNSTGSNTPSISSSENSSPICERPTNTTNRRVSESNPNSQQITLTSPVHLSPPAWIPDQKAPRCMSCNTPFTAFRRRHHCRNCGGVFCGVCSNNFTPIPKYGLTKAVRVCRSCFVHELSLNSITTASAPNQNHHNHHHNHHSQLVSQVTTNTTNNEPRLRRPVTTTRAID